MPLFRAAALFAFAAPMLAACGGGAPYLLSDYRNHQRGQVEVCFDDHKTTAAQVHDMAEGVCNQYDRMAVLQLKQRNQCNWRTPELALFYCVPRPGETPAPLVPQKAPLRSPQTGG